MEEAVAADASGVGMGGSVALEMIIALLNLAVGNARAAAGDEAYGKRAPMSRRRSSSRGNRFGDVQVPGSSQQLQRPLLHSRPSAVTGRFLAFLLPPDWTIMGA